MSAKNVSKSLGEITFGVLVVEVEDRVAGVLVDKPKAVLRMDQSQADDTRPEIFQFMQGRKGVLPENKKK